MTLIVEMDPNTKMKVIRVILSHDSEENYKLNHIVHSNVETDVEECATKDEGAECVED